MRNALSIDVEEHFQVHNLERGVPRSQWESHASRVVDNTHRVLDLVERHGQRATFFVLGWVAQRHPELVRDIAARGHEVASHGYGHCLIYQQNREAFRQDLQRSLAVLRQAVGPRHAAAIVGYRAPSFSITAAVPWAVDEIQACGLRYDSSVMPAGGHDRYGMPQAERSAHVLANGLLECPLSTIRLFGRNWPVAGGGYFRLFPLWFTRWALRRINEEGMPAVIYLHPWEFDPGQPRIRGASAWLRFRHYVNLARTESRLACLLQEFEFAPLRDVFAALLEGRTTADATSDT